MDRFRWLEALFTASEFSIMTKFAWADEPIWQGVC